MKQGRALGVFVVVPVIIGAVGIITVARSPEFSAFRSVDVVQLIASGMCFGVSLAWIVRVFRGPSAS
jgi:hypothetical protein